MRYCKTCNIHYHTPLTKCMFCNNELNRINNSPEDNLYPPVIIEKKKRHFILRLFIFLYVIINIICFYIDYQSNQRFLWSPLVLNFTSYALLLLILYLRKYTYTFKIFTTLLLTYLNLLLTGFIIDNYSWAVDFVLPFGIILMNVVMTSFVIGKATKLYDNAIYLFIGCLLCLLPLIFLLNGVTSIAWPTVACCLYSVFTLLGLFIFSSKETKDELMRRLHL